MRTKALVSIFVFVALILSIMVIYNLLILRVEPDIDLEIAAGYSTTAAVAAATAETAATMETAAAETAAADAATTTPAVTSTSMASADAEEAGTVSDTRLDASDSALVGEIDAGDAGTAGDAAVSDAAGDAGDVAVSDAAGDASDAGDAAGSDASDEASDAGGDSVEDLQEAPDFSMVDWEGNETKLSDLIAIGKPIVLNFWASWCPPCIGEMPEFNKIFLEIGDDVQFIMLNMTDGQRETKEIGAKFIEDQGYSFPVFFDVNQNGASIYGIRYIPTTVFINSSGYIVAGAQSALDETLLRKGIDMIK